MNKSLEAQSARPDSSPSTLTRRQFLKQAAATIAVGAFGLPRLPARQGPRNP